MSTKNSNPTGEFEKYEISRDGQRPLRFTGTLIVQDNNQPSFGLNQNRWTDIALYRTKGGKFVIRVKQISQWANEKNSCRAAALDTAAEVIAWLAADNDGHLGRLSQAILEKAAKQLPEFNEAYAEEVQ